MTCNLMAKRDMRKREKQDSQVRDSKSSMIEFDNHIKDLQRTASNHFGRCRRESYSRLTTNSNLTYSSSEITKVTNSIKNYREQHAVVSTITHNLKSTRYEKENSRFESESDVISDFRTEGLQSTNSVVDLRPKQFSEISMNQLSPIRDEYSKKDVISKKSIKIVNDKAKTSSLSLLQKQLK